MYKWTISISIIIILLSQAFLYAIEQEVPNVPLPIINPDEVIATGKEIKGYDNHVKLGNEFWNVFNANYGSIKTWQGHANVIKKTWTSKDKAELRYHLEYSVEYHLDMINPRYRYVSTGNFGISYRTGERRPMTLSREAVLMQKDEISGKLISAYTSHHYMEEVPPEERSKFASTLHITTSRACLY